MGRRPLSPAVTTPYRENKTSENDAAEGVGEQVGEDGAPDAAGGFGGADDGDRAGAEEEVERLRAAQHVLRGVVEGRSVHWQLQVLRARKGLQSRGRLKPRLERFAAE